MTRTVAGARVLITGAAMGMGRLYAERAVAEGAKSVILWDRGAAAVEVSAAASRSQRITDFAPSATARSAYRRPIPMAAPVISTRAPATVRVMGQSSQVFPVRPVGAPPSWHGGAGKGSDHVRHGAETQAHEQAGLRGRAAAFADRAGGPAAVGHGVARPHRRRLRGAGCGRQGLRDQARDRVPQSPHRPDRGTAGADGPRAGPVVL